MPRIAFLLWAILPAACWCAAADGPAEAGGEDVVQAQVVLTVAESKRLIAKAVAEMPIVKRALADGMVIICKGTTNTYVAEEIVGESVVHGAYVYGRTYPAKGGKHLESVPPVQEYILVKGKVQLNLTLADAVKQLKPGDVVIKGANALNYENQTAAVLAGSPTGGTTGTILPFVVARKAHLVIPIGLEKEVSGQVMDIANAMREPVPSLNDIPTMFLLTGHIVTEIEALRILADTFAFQAAAGGIGGAEGAVRLVCRDARPKVERALAVVEAVQGEPAFVE